MILVVSNKEVSTDNLLMKDIFKYQVVTFEQAMKLKELIGSSLEAVLVDRELSKLDGADDLKTEYFDDLDKSLDTLFHSDNEINFSGKEVLVNNSEVLVKNQELEAEVNRLTTERDDLARKVADVRGQLNKSNLKTDELMNEVEMLRASLDSIENTTVDNSVDSSVVEGYEAQIDEYKEKVGVLEAQLNESMSSIEELKSARDKITADYEAQQDSVLYLKDKIMGYEESERSLKDKVVSLEEELKDKDNTTVIDELNSQIASLNVEIEALSSRNQNLETNLNDARNSLSNAELQLNEATSYSEQLKSQLDDAQVSFNMLKDDFDKAQGNNRASEGFAKFESFADAPRGVNEEEFDVATVELLKQDGANRVSVICAGADSLSSLCDQIRTNCNLCSDYTIVDFTGTTLLGELLRIEPNKINNTSWGIDNNTDLSLYMSHLKNNINVIPSGNANDISLLKKDWVALIRKMLSYDNTSRIIIVLGEVNSFNVRYTVAKLASAVRTNVYMLASSMSVIRSTVDYLALMGSKRVNLVACNVVENSKSIIANACRQLGVTSTLIPRGNALTLDSLTGGANR